MYSAIVRRDRKKKPWVKKGEEPPGASSNESSENDESAAENGDSAAPTQAPGSPLPPNTQPAPGK